MFVHVVGFDDDFVFVEVEGVGPDGLAVPGGVVDIEDLSVVVVDVVIKCGLGRRGVSVAGDPEFDLRVQNEDLVDLGGWLGEASRASHFVVIRDQCPGQRGVEEDDGWFLLVGVECLLEPFEFVLGHFCRKVSCHVIGREEDEEVAHHFLRAVQGAEDLLVILEVLFLHAFAGGDDVAFFCKDIPIEDFMVACGEYLRLVQVVGEGFDGVHLVHGAGKGDHIARECDEVYVVPAVDFLKALLLVVDFILAEFRIVRACLCRVVEVGDDDDSLIVSSVRCTACDFAARGGARAAGNGHGKGCGRQKESYFLIQFHPFFHNFLRPIFTSIIQFKL